MCSSDLSDEVLAGLWVVVVIKVRNRVFKTQFPCHRHVKKYVRSDHGNRVFKTRFISENRASKTRDASN